VRPSLIGATAGELLVWRPQGPFGFAVPEPLLPSQTIGEGVKVGDIDGDGLSDFMGIERQPNQTVLVIGLQRQGGQFEITRYPLNIEAAVGALLHDMDGDGRVDVLLGGGARQVYLIKQGPNGVFDAPRQLPFLFDFTLATAGDVNSDGRADLIFGDRNAGALWILTQQPDGSFRAAEDYPRQASSGYSFMPVILGDVTGDGRADIVWGGYMMRQRVQPTGQTHRGRPLAAWRDVVNSKSPKALATRH
jgi:FG-GAP-like repeat